MAETIAVIGAGIGGLSVAARLAAAGYEVHVFEKQSGPGGKAFSETNGGYRFDTGPSLMTLREAFSQFFEETDRRMEDYLDLEPLKPVCNYFYPDGTRLSTFQDRDRLATEFERVFGEAPEHIHAYLDDCSRVGEIASPFFLWKSPHERSTFRGRQFWSSLFRLSRIHSMTTLDRVNRRAFRSPKLHQLFNRYATYNGSSPYRTPGTMVIVPHAEYNLGAFSVAGGIYAIPRAFEAVSREHGVTFHYDTLVDSIVTTPGGGRGRNGGAVSGIEVGGVFRPFDVVISNADVLVTYEKLLRDTRSPRYRRYRRMEPSSSVIVYFWGVRRTFPELDQHNIFFSDDYAREFREIFDEHRAPEDPTIYVNITSKTTPGDAPEGGENWFVLVNAPYDSGQDWESEAARTRTTVISRLNAELGVDLENLIEVESRLVPTDIEARTESYRGALYGIALNSPTAAFRRHPNRCRRYPGLFFVGGSAHPGGGMPLVTLSGKITADLVRAYFPLTGRPSAE